MILPETGTEGAAVFTDRLATRLVEVLTARGAWAGGAPVTATATFPADDDLMTQLRAQFAAIDRVEHPGHPVEAEVRPAD